jgi:methyl-accepting chemotaxis protein
MAQMDFGLARLNHQVWKMRLRSFLNDKEVMNASEAMSHQDCDLGKWMYGGALDEFAHIPEMRQLEAVHANMHRQIKSIIVNKNSGKIDEAKEEFKEIGPISAEIVELLTAVEKQTK